MKRGASILLCLVILVVPTVASAAGGLVTVKISVSSSGEPANGWSYCSRLHSSNYDGTRIVLGTTADNLLGTLNSFPGIVVRDVARGTTQRVDLSSSGEPANGTSYSGVISSDGMTVAFTSDASNLAPRTGDFIDVYVRSLAQGWTKRLSVDITGTGSNGDSGHPALSADGATAVFDSGASNLVAGDDNDVVDIFLWRRSHKSALISMNRAGRLGNGPSRDPDISGDGRYVVFSSDATNLVRGDIEGHTDVFLEDARTGAIRRISLTPDGRGGNGDSGFPAISEDGRWASFTSDASDLVPGDTNGVADVFVQDLRTGITQIATVSSRGDQQNAATVEARSPLSRHGRMIEFMSPADNLVPGDTNGVTDIFARDLLRGITRRVSVSSAGEQANDFGYNCGLSGDGRVATFYSYATNLAEAGDTNLPDVFAREPLPSGGG